MRFAVVANEGQRIDIPDGCILENRLLSGNLNMIVRFRHSLIRILNRTDLSPGIVINFTPCILGSDKINMDTSIVLNTSF
jgi:hypothetical protein